MEKEKSTPAEEESKELFEEEEERESTPQKEEDSEKEKSEDISDEAFLKKVNEVEGRNYKSIEDYQKTVKERNKDFSEEGQKKKPIESTPKNDTGLSDEDIIETYFDNKPKAQLVMDDIKEIAKSKGISEIQVWKTEKWLHKKADELAEDEENKGKIGDPSNNVAEKKTLDETKKMAQKFATDLPPGFEYKPTK